MGAGATGESPEIARHLELLDRISENHLEINLGLEGVKGHLGILTQSLNSHADEDGRRFEAHSNAIAANTAALNAHIVLCGDKLDKGPPRKGRIGAAVLGLLAGLGGLGTWLSKVFGDNGS